MGLINEDNIDTYGKVLSEHMNESSLFIVSTDFCHWGNRFGYTYLGDSIAASGDIHIWQKIKKLDFEAMKFIENIDIKSLMTYVNETGATICGQYAILVLLSTISHLSKAKYHMKFVAYDQSSKIKSHSESSVSYASAYFAI